MGRVAVTVVGAGVIGLSVACELAERGHQVTVVAERPASETVSAVAGALWFPYTIDDSAATLTQLEISLRRFVALAEQPGTGVALREGLLVERETSSRAWMEVVADFATAEPRAWPPGATAAYRMTLPMIDTPHYLNWLADRAASLGVRSVRGAVSDLAEVTRSGDLVVVAAGLGSPGLVGDDDPAYPVQGQVVRLANPGLRRWYVDDEAPDGMTYVLPRSKDIVCGGTAVAGAETAWDAAVEAAILQRCTALVPELAGLPVVSRAVGLRPARSSVRVELLDRWAVPVVTCYGHGGAGVTASWGTAVAVADLVDAAVAPSLD